MPARLTCRKCRMPQHVDTARSCYYCGSVDLAVPEPPAVCESPAASCDDSCDDHYGEPMFGYAGLSTD